MRFLFVVLGESSFSALLGELLLALGVKGIGVDIAVAPFPCTCFGVVPGLGVLMGVLGVRVRLVGVRFPLLFLLRMMVSTFIADFVSKGFSLCLEDARFLT